MVFVIAGLVTSVEALCGLVSALFQYFMLVFFGWTAAEAVYLCRSIKNYVVKAAIVIWGQLVLYKIIVDTLLPHVCMYMFTYV